MVSSALSCTISVIPTTIVLAALGGGTGYWNQIRRDFPDIFADRAQLEREIGHAILRNRQTGDPLFLDELDPAAGRMQDEIMEDCGIFCMLAMDNQERQMMD